MEGPMTAEKKTEVDHSRGLCGKPDHEGVGRKRCRCCGSVMQESEPSSSGMAELGMYWVHCPTCPPRTNDETRS